MPGRLHYEGQRMLYTHSGECADCGACEPVCPDEAIFCEDDVPGRGPSSPPRTPGSSASSDRPVLADTSCSFPGRPVPPWPAAVPGEPFQVPSGRGITRLASDATTGRCARCGRAFRRRIDGMLTAHDAGGQRGPGGGQPPAEDTVLATWLPVRSGLTPHGLRHGHQTWMEEAGISDLLRSERMGHEVPGMRGVYGHVSPAMRADLKAVLQERWEASLCERAQLPPRSIVPVLDALLTAQREQHPFKAEIVKR
jgi:ferredoxin